MTNWYITPSNDDLMHYGVLGMKWGVRRYQNKDGSLTDAGKKRYADELMKGYKNASYSRYTNESFRNKIKNTKNERFQKNIKELNKEYIKFNNKWYNTNEKLERIEDEFHNEMLRKYNYDTTKFTKEDHEKWKNMSNDLLKNNKEYKELFEKEAKINTEWKKYVDKNIIEPYLGENANRTLYKIKDGNDYSLGAGFVNTLLDYTSDTMYDYRLLHLYRGNGKLIK